MQGLSGWSEHRAGVAVDNGAVSAHFVTLQPLITSIHFLKSGVSERCKGWSVLISGDFTDKLQTPITVRKL